MRSTMVDLFLIHEAETPKQPCHTSSQDEPLIDPVPAPLPPLRVAIPQSPQPLRVDPIATPVGPILIPVNDSISQARIIPAPKLVPKIVPQDGPYVIPIETANLMHIVLLAPTPTPPIIEYVSPLVATFENSTGSKGHRHCKATRKQPLKTKKSSPPATTAHLTAVPNIGHHTAMPSTLILANFPSTRNSPSAVKGNFGNVETHSRLGALPKVLVISTLASKTPTPCSSLTTRKFQKNARSPT